MRERFSDRSFVIDISMAVVLFVSSLMSMVGLPDIESAQPVDPFAIILIATGTLSLAWRRRTPVTVVGIGLVTSMVYAAIGYPPSWAVFGLAFALYAVGTELHLKKSSIVGGITIAIAVAWTAVGAIVIDVPWTAVLGTLLFYTFPWLLGVESHRRSQRALVLEARVITAEILREQAAADAVRVERARIARELHDAVAHEMTVMTVHAAAAERAVDDNPADAKHSLVIVQDAGRRGLTEMRRLLGLLREGDEVDSSPQPGIASLPDLTSQMVAVGLPTDLSIEGEPREVSAGVDLSVYRIIQESLTNVIRHAGPDVHATVRVVYAEDELRITVADDGRGAAERLESPDSGHGLDGMKERAALLGGTVFAGPSPGGGYHVHATIPMVT